MKIKLLLFARLREIFGKGEAAVELPAKTTARDALNILFTENPGMRNAARSFLFAVNERYVPPDTLLREGDELAIIPPVSGG